MDLMEIVWEDMHWMHVPQIRDQCRALVKRVINLGFQQKAGIT